MKQCGKCQIQQTMKFVNLLMGIEFLWWLLMHYHKTIHIMSFQVSIFSVSEDIVQVNIAVSFCATLFDMCPMLFIGNCDIILSLSDINIM